jgi:two-component system sensor histidine kinase BaeS
LNKLWVRLVLAFLVVAWLGIGAMALVVRATTERSFRQYVNQRETSFFNEDVITSLEDHYAATGSWAGAESLLPGRRGGGGQGSGGGQGNGAGGGRGGQGQGGAVVLLADAAGVVVASTDETRIGTTLSDTARERAVELTVDGERVGWLAQETPGTQALGAAEHRFLDEATRWLTGAAIGAALLAVIVGIALAWQLTRPMRVLTDAAHDLAGGQLGRQVDVSGTAEITELGRAFNRMSRDLAAGETLRQRMAADIAHELRTPVSVLRGHLEAMLDGVFPLDAEHLAVAYDRTIHLTRLVDDLRLLTRAEAGQLPLQRVTITPADLVGRAVASFAPLALDAGITLTHEVAPDAPSVHVDLDRMQQVLGNLLTNALRHTPEGGQIALRVTRAGESARFAVTNTGEGLTPEQAANVFTPFWRAEDARERDSGGSGLGLAITRQLLALHGGSIWVESQPGQTAFVFDLPGEVQKQL